MMDENSKRFDAKMNKLCDDAVKGRNILKQKFTDKTFESTAKPISFKK